MFETGDEVVLTHVAGETQNYVIVGKCVTVCIRPTKSSPRWMDVTDGENWYTVKGADCIRAREWRG